MKNDIPLTALEALEEAKNESKLSQVFIIMIKEDKSCSWLQGGGLLSRDILWWIEQVKRFLLKG